MNSTQKSVLLGVFIPSKNQPISKTRKPRRILFNSLKDEPLSLDNNLEFKFTFKNRKTTKSLLLKAKSLLKEAKELEKGSLKKDNISTTISSIDKIIDNKNIINTTTNANNNIDSTNQINLGSPSLPKNKVEIKSPLKKNKIELKPLGNTKKLNIPTTWADIVGKNINKTNKNINISLKDNKVSRPPNLKANKSSSYKDQRLVLITKDKTQKIDYYILKEKINIKLKNQLKINNNIITSINKNRNNNIIITTRDGYSPSILLKNQQLWQEYFKFNKIIKDKDYYNLIIHDINNRIYNTNNNINPLLKIKEDLKKDNPGLSIIGNPKWISKKENRANKLFSSIIISLNSEGEREKYLNKKIFIGGKTPRVEKFISKPPINKDKRAKA